MIPTRAVLVLTAGVAAQHGDQARSGEARAENGFMRRGFSSEQELGLA